MSCGGDGRCEGVAAFEALSEAARVSARLPRSRCALPSLAAAYGTRRATCSFDEPIAIGGLPFSAAA